MNEETPKYPIDNSVKFVHLREMDMESGCPLPQGGITVAFTLVKEREEPEGTDLYWAARAECSQRDNFCKKTGRSIATGRLRCGQIDEVLTSKTKMREISEVMEQWALAG